MFGTFFLSPLLICKISAGKSTDSLMGVPFYVTSCFSLAVFKILSLFLTFDILIIMCFGMDLFGFSLNLSLLPEPGYFFPSPDYAGF